MMLGKASAAFTIIEMIIAVSVMGILAVIVIVLVDPVERNAQSRDTGRMSSVFQIGHAVEAFQITRNQYPAKATWAQDLIDAGELSTFPGGIGYLAYEVFACDSFAQPSLDSTYCYDHDVANGAIVFSRAEANSHNSKCSSGGAYFVYSTADGRSGTICSTGDPTPWAPGTQTYVD